MSLWLTAEELAHLTGAKQARLQVEWLKKWGVRHYVRRDKKPVVLWADMVGPQEPQKVRPNREAVRRQA